MAWAKKKFVAISSFSSTFRFLKSVGKTLQLLQAPEHGISIRTGKRPPLLLILRYFVSVFFAWIWFMHLRLFVLTLVGQLFRWENLKASSNSSSSDMFLDVVTESKLKSPYIIAWFFCQQGFPKASKTHWRI